MLKCFRVHPLTGHFLRQFSTTNKTDFKVTVIGGCGGIGQPLGLLLKRQPLISTLALYDTVRTPGIYADLSHIDTKTNVEGYQCPENLPAALDGAHIVLVAGGTARKPGMTRDDLFTKNVDVVSTITPVIAAKCPKALIAVITNPVNSCVPLAAEILKQKKVYDPKRLFGVTTLDLVRSRTFISEILNVEPEKVSIPVIGGHSGETIMPILSQCKPTLKLDKDKAKQLIKRIQEAGTEVVKAKALDGGTSATLSVAHAVELFTKSLLLGLNGDCQPIECTYVASDVTECAFFATPCQIGKNGIEKNLGLPKLDESEEAMLCEAIETLKKNIKTGVDYAKKLQEKDGKSKDKKCG
ncbi:malate dehydrogenase, mitochondrial-like isoform X2 [Eurosta solidaginis]